MMVGEESPLLALLTVGVFFGSLFWRISLEWSGNMEECWSLGSRLTGQVNWRLEDSMFWIGSWKPVYWLEEDGGSQGMLLILLSELDLLMSVVEGGQR